MPVSSQRFQSAAVIDPASAQDYYKGREIQLYKPAGCTFVGTTTNKVSNSPPIHIQGKSRTLVKCIDSAWICKDIAPKHGQAIRKETAGYGVDAIVFEAEELKITVEATYQH